MRANHPKILYLDVRYPSGWVHDPPNIAGWMMKGEDFDVADADQLATWMRERIERGAAGTVCVLLQGIAPDTIAETMGPGCTARRYLEEGGRIVWIGDVPFYYQGRSGGGSKTWGSAGHQQILGFPNGWDRPGQAQITEEGKAFGMRQPDRPQRPVDAAQVTKVLSLTVAGEACSWLKTYAAGVPGSGFLRYRGCVFGCAPEDNYPECINDLIRVSIHGLPARGGGGAPRPAGPDAGMIETLVAQFSNPLDFYREIIQNSIDAGCNRVEVSLEHEAGGEAGAAGPGTSDRQRERGPVPPPGQEPRQAADVPAAGGSGVAVIRIEDDGDGMDERILEECFLVKFRSTKEGDFTKIGKFGIGFVSVFAPRPELVSVHTARGGESWRVDFPSPERYEKYRVDAPRDGTLVEIRKAMPREEYDRLVPASIEAVKRWCRHAATRITFEDRSAAPRTGPLPANEPFDLPGGASLRHVEEGTEIVLGFSADPEPFFGLYNRGLTLQEGRRAHLPGVSYKISSRYLEHTLTRDQVMQDESYRKAIGIVERLARRGLPARLRDELASIAPRAAARAAAGEDVPEPDPLADGWLTREPFLRTVLEGRHGKWKAGSWAIFPTVRGSAVSLEALREGVEKASGDLLEEGRDGAIPAALEARGIPVLAPGPWAECAARLLSEPGTVRASEAWILPSLLPEAGLPADLVSLLRTLREADRATAARYADIRAASFEGGQAAGEEPIFLVQEEPGAIVRRGERPVSSIFHWGTRRRRALLDASHPFVERLAAIHAARPGLAAYLGLKVLYLHDGKVPPAEEARYSNLADRLERGLLLRAIGLDAAAAAVRRGAQA